ncbi:tripartite tricarboxylate transporter substrate binding protein [Variovorax guangxiensis]|uniref:Bug family tripartite tricarboxylate transporter substrate binding protein n=1 Tax=Variovorax guangxiensis TaxID=1775474 RepID=UPI002857A03A|nr:tripartite tricarboxylate transporter substrate binding protein [Variovorax guangxiensis]MDR6858752.1 tripartite-type tricarboxylate transporter receptor subunit TctC [Variovorax guangxiensis]
MRLFRGLLFAALFPLLVAPTLAGAQSFPDKPVRVISPFPTGTGIDAVMRLVGERLSRIWHQPVIIDNRPGGNGFIAMSAAKRAPADGYTLVQIDYGLVTVSPHLFARTIPYDPQKDFEPAAPMFWAYWFICVPADTKFKNIPDMIAEAKDRNGTLTYGSSGIGSPMHLQAAMFEDATGVRMTHVPYKDTQQAIIDISRGELGWAVASGGTAGPLQKAKKVKFLAVASPQRHPAFPDIPTMTEAGGPQNFDLRTWNGLLAPKGVPKPILDKINADINRVLAEPHVRERLLEMAFDPWPATRSDVADLMRIDLQRYGDLMKHLKISLD